MVKKSCLLGILAVIACAPERIIETASTPQLTQERRTLSDSEYVAACKDRTATTPISSAIRRKIQSL
jgi:hypothetical protein